VENLSGGYRDVQIIKQTYDRYINLLFRDPLGIHSRFHRRAAPVSATVKPSPQPIRWICSLTHNLDPPTDPSEHDRGTDKGALDVYDLSGARLQSIPVATGNVDLRYNFPLGGERVALVTAFSKDSRGLVAFKVDPATRQLVEVLDESVSEVAGGGISLYHSPVTGKFYYLSNRAGVLNQYELFDTGSGQVGVNLVRTVKYGAGTTEAVTADDVHAYIYLSDEDETVWRLGAEPGSGDAKTMIDTTIAAGGHLQPDIEELTIYYKSLTAGVSLSQPGIIPAVYTLAGDKDTYLGTYDANQDH
jgi:3-phytase